jgi:hypothetical protein
MTDSGYHGTTDDEMDIDHFPAPPTQASSSTQPFYQENKPVEPHRIERIEEERRHTEETYVSAKSSFGSRKPSDEDLRGNDDAFPEQDADIIMTGTQEPVEEPEEEEPTTAAPTSSAKGKGKAVDDVNDDLEDDEQVSSKSSSPEKPLLRKSSLTFSALPAREPLAKKSIGPQQAQRSSIVDQFKAAIGRTSALGRYTGGKSLGGSHNAAQHGDDDDSDDNDSDDNDKVNVDGVIRPNLSRQESETTRMHNKTSTQRLHEKINMLGKAREVRPSKSIPFNASVQQQLYPQIPSAQQDQSNEHAAQPTSSKAHPELIRAVNEEEDEDDWIAPVKPVADQPETTWPPLTKSNAAHVMEQIYGDQTPQKSPKRGLFGHKKNQSTISLVSPTKAAMAPDASMQKPISVSNPNPSVESFTPVGSPTGKKLMGDGALSASKAKLYSVLRSAKGIFASSAGVSAQAKMEAISPPPPPRHQPSREDLLSPRPEIAPVPALYPNLQPAVPEPEPRHTRSSTEREQKKKEHEARQRQKAADDLEKARQKERHKAAAHAAKEYASRPPSPTKSLYSVAGASKETLADSNDGMPPPPPPKSLLPQTSQHRLRETRRIERPVRAQPAKAKPVAVRMPSQRIGHMAPSNSALSHSAQEPAPPPVPPKHPTMNSKPSNASINSASSSTNLKGSASAQSARKALEAAKKKKEEEAKAAQRKAEQKRELEQRRLAKIEEERRLEQQRKAAEHARIAEAKKAAQRQAAEAKRLEQQRKEAQRPPSRGQQHNDLASVLQQEKSHAPQAHQRGDLGGARPVGRMPLVHDQQARPIVQINPAKPPKRMLQFEADEEPPQQRPTLGRNPPSYQQLDAKRRKTNEEEEQPQEQRRSVMAPPIRHSNMRKVRQRQMLIVLSH